MHASSRSHELHSRHVKLELVAGLAVANDIVQKLEARSKLGNALDRAWSARAAECGSLYPKPWSIIFSQIRDAIPAKSGDSSGLHE
jgi:hypothetical protein